MSNKRPAKKPGNKAGSTKPAPKGKAAPSFDDLVDDIKTPDQVPNPAPAQPEVPAVASPESPATSTAAESPNPEEVSNVLAGPIPIYGQLGGADPLDDEDQDWETADPEDPATDGKLLAEVTGNITDPPALDSDLPAATPAAPTPAPVTTPTKPAASLTGTSTRQETAKVIFDLIEASNFLYKKRRHNLPDEKETELRRRVAAGRALIEELNQDERQEEETTLG